MPHGPQVPVRRVLALAVPALGVLAAEPLYLLVDTAVVGRLGAVPLAALAVGGVVLVQVSTGLTFLSYGTTARTARLYGSGQRAAAVAEGAQASWLALGVGGVVLVGGQLVASPVVRLLAGPGPVADAALEWLRIALFGAPFVLVTLAGNGWMRGVQETARPLRYVLAGNGISALLCPVLVHGAGPVAGIGLPGSAVANVVAQVLAAGLFLRALVVERVT
ncbi:MAG: MATE family efflux transporter, partial [Pseudonocardiaceae bacterium]